MRFALAGWWFLNADEALHYLLSSQPTLALAYKASLTTAHPPLLILLLHLFSAVGRGELFLRLPSVVSGTAFCGVMFLWLRKVRGPDTALVALSLLLFSPALIYLSTEIRQYSLLLFFSSCSLYFLERAIWEQNRAWMALSATALYLALLTHYSALIVALTLGVYALLRLNDARASRGLVATWILAELGALALIAFLWRSHVQPLRTRGMPQNLSESYLRGSIFHPGEDHVLAFIARANLRVFHFLFSQGAISVLGLLLFAAGLVVLATEHGPAADPRAPRPRQLAWLLGLPFLINLSTALLGLYPYGGTRHNAYLAGFAMSGVAVAIARWRPGRTWMKPAVIALALALSNLLVVPAGAYITPRNQRRALMAEAMRYLANSVPPHSIIFTDLEGGLLLSYYLCHAQVVQLEAPIEPFLSSSCGALRVISLDPRLWIFRAEAFPAELDGMEGTYRLDPDTPIWVFQAGFIVDREPEFRAELARYGCDSAQEFGKNIFLCKIRLARPVGWAP